MGHNFLTLESGEAGIDFPQLRAKPKPVNLFALFGIEQEESPLARDERIKKLFKVKPVKDPYAALTTAQALDPRFFNSETLRSDGTLGKFSLKRAFFVPKARYKGLQKDVKIAGIVLGVAAASYVAWRYAPALFTKAGAAGASKAGAAGAGTAIQGAQLTAAVKAAGGVAGKAVAPSMGAKLLTLFEQSGAKALMKEAGSVYIKTKAEEALWHYKADGSVDKYPAAQVPNYGSLPYNVPMAGGGGGANTGGESLMPAQQVGSTSLEPADGGLTPEPLYNGEEPIPPEGEIPPARTAAEILFDQPGAEADIEAGRFIPEEQTLEALADFGPSLQRKRRPKIKPKKINLATLCDGNLGGVAVKHLIVKGQRPPPPYQNYAIYDGPGNYNIWYSDPDAEAAEAAAKQKAAATITTPIYVPPGLPPQGTATYMPTTTATSASELINPYQQFAPGLVESYAAIPQAYRGRVESVAPQAPQAAPEAPTPQAPSGTYEEQGERSLSYLADFGPDLRRAARKSL